MKFVVNSAKCTTAATIQWFEFVHKSLWLRSAQKKAVNLLPALPMLCCHLEVIKRKLEVKVQRRDEEVVAVVASAEA